MSLNKNCQKTTTPKVDNTEHKCDPCGYTEVECVVSDDGFPYLGLLGGMSLKLIIKSIVDSLIKKGNRLLKLEKYYTTKIVTTADTTIANNDTHIYFAPSSAAGNAPLPAASIANKNRDITFINYSGSTKTIGIYRTGELTTSTTIVTNIVLKLRCIGTEWVKI